MPPTHEPVRLDPDRLRSPWVTLEPVGDRTIDDHGDDLAEAANAETFRYFPDAPVTIDRAGMAAYIARLRAQRNAVHFVVLDRDGRAGGMTSYCDIRAGSLGLEIGWTWIAERLRGGPTNPAMKFLLLGHAFETALFGGDRSGDGHPAVRVQLKARAANAHSRRAIEKLGARLEGILRKHTRTPDGTIMDSALYSMLAEEWPEARARLNERLAAFAGA